MTRLLRLHLWSMTSFATIPAILYILLGGSAQTQPKQCKRKLHIIIDRAGAQLKENLPHL